MPNHVANFVNITGKDKEKLISLMKSKDNPFDFNSILPCPEILLNRISPFRPEGSETEEEAETLRKELKEKYGADTWYEWCNENWSTKWNSYEHFEPEGYDYGFYTAWGPPDAVYRALSKRFEAKITVIDHDEGGEFCTEMEYEDGQLVSMRDLEEKEVEMIEAMREYY